MNNLALQNMNSLAPFKPKELPQDVSSLFPVSNTEAKIQSLAWNEASNSNTKTFYKEDFFKHVDEAKESFNIQDSNEAMRVILQDYKDRWYKLEWHDIDQELSNLWFWEQIETIETEESDDNIAQKAIWWTAEALQNIWGALKMEAWNSLLDKSNNPFVRSFWNLVEAFKFAWNIPWRTIEIVWELWSVLANPIDSAKSFNALWKWIIETGLSEIFLKDWQRHYTSEDNKLAVEWMTQALKENFWSIEAVRKTIIENPTDFLTALNWWLSLAKKGVKNTNTINNINALQDKLNPITILKTEWKLLLETWKLPLKGAKELTVQLLWKTTGAGAESIRTAFKQWWNKSFAKALAGEITDEDILLSAKRWFETIKNQRNEIYWTDYNKIIQNKTKLWLNDVEDILIKNLDDAKVIIKPDTKWFSLDFSKSTITQKASQTQIKEMFDDIIYWSDDTPEGLDILKQRIQDRWIWWEGTSKADRLSTVLWNTVKDKIIAEVPEYAKMVQKYEKITNELKEIDRVLRLWNEKSKMTAITRLGQSMKDNISFRKEMVDKLEELSWIDIKSAIAWSSLKDLMPKGLAGAIAPTWIGYWIGAWIITPSLIPILLASSPRLIWQLARAIWITKDKFIKWLENAKAIFNKQKIQNNNMQKVPQTDMN